jgi:hypothetical protein
MIRNWSTKHCRASRLTAPVRRNAKFNISVRIKAMMPSRFVAPHVVENTPRTFPKGARVLQFLNDDAAEHAVGLWNEPTRGPTAHDAC